MTHRIKFTLNFELFHKMRLPKRLKNPQKCSLLTRLGEILAEIWKHFNEFESGLKNEEFGPQKSRLRNHLFFRKTPQNTHF